MDDFLVGALAIILGAGICFFGLRVWFVMLPIWGFFVGFWLGAAGFQAIFGEGFLRDVTSWIVGIVVGLVGAVVSYLFWYVGALLAAGSFGALVGSGLMNAFGADTDWVVAIVAALGFVLAIMIAFLLALPVYVVLVSTALVGSATVVVGVMLVFNQMNVEHLEWGMAWAMIEESWFWLIAWAVVAAVGIGYQLMQVERAALPDDPWARASADASATHSVVV